MLGDVYVGNIAGEKYGLSSYKNVNEARNHSTLFIRKNPACYDPLDRQTPSLLEIAFEIIRYGIQSINSGNR